MSDLPDPKLYTPAEAASLRVDLGERLRQSYRQVVRTAMENGESSVRFEECKTENLQAMLAVAQELCALGWDAKCGRHASWPASWHAILWQATPMEEPNAEEPKPKSGESDERRWWKFWRTM